MIASGETAGRRGGAGWANSSKAVKKAKDAAARAARESDGPNKKKAKTSPAPAATPSPAPSTAPATPTKATPPASPPPEFESENPSDRRLREASIRLEGETDEDFAHRRWVAEMTYNFDEAEVAADKEKLQNTQTKAGARKAPKKAKAVATAADKKEEGAQPEVSEDLPISASSNGFTDDDIEKLAKMRKWKDCLHIYLAHC